MMGNGSRAVLLVIAVVALGAGGLTIYSSSLSRRALFDAVQNRNDAIAGEAYACGYMAGMRGMSTALGHAEVGPQELASCPPFKANAAAHGFNQP